MQRYAFLLGLWLSMLTGSCMEPAELSYTLAFDARVAQRRVLARAFLRWGEATGVAIHEAEDPGDARVVFSEGKPPPGKFGLAAYHAGAFFDPASLHTITYLKSASVVFSPDLWKLDFGDQLKFLNHEIGHIMTAGDHSDVCPSTMNPDFYACGSETIDPDSRDRAVHLIDQGWLWRPVRPSL